MACNRAGAVAFLQALQIPALNAAGPAFALAGALHVHAVALREDVGLDNVAHVQGAGVVEAELAQGLLRRNVTFFKVALHGLVHAVQLQLAIAELYAFIAICFRGLLLDDGAGAGFHHGDRDDISLGVKDLRHADLLADDTFLHVSFLLIGLLVGQFSPT